MKAVYAELRKVSADEATRARANDLREWQDDPKRLALGICRHFLGDRGDVVVVVMDNVDRLDLKNQLQAFQLALWFMAESRAFTILQMRDETYERFKGQPPLDTHRTGVGFHITPPRFLDVVKKRLELSLEYLSDHTGAHLEYQLHSGTKIIYPNSRLGEFLREVYLELFERRGNVSRVLQGLAGRDVRRALEMFVAILISGHLREEQLTSSAVGAGTLEIREYTILKILMRTEYRFFSNVSGFVSNLYFVHEDWTQANNFLISDILFWLHKHRRKSGTIGLEGYFSVDHLADSLQLRGYVRDDVISACTWLVQRQLIESDRMNILNVKASDSIKITASGFIHLRILSGRLEYIYGVLSVTPICDERILERIADYIDRENRQKHISGYQMVQCVEYFLMYLRDEFAKLSAAYPSFGEKETGASYILSQIQGSIDHFRRPGESVANQPNSLDD